MTEVEGRTCILVQYFETRYGVFERTIVYVVRRMVSGCIVPICGPPPRSLEVLRLITLEREPKELVVEYTAYTSYVVTIGIKQKIMKPRMACLNVL